MIIFQIIKIKKIRQAIKSDFINVVDNLINMADNLINVIKFFA